ncbi:Alpha/Beta hydrolase protein [Entophlyctis helioformis]|nr:Alpha/Beta hydrolase protein [Entophlyctis helioformis]
MFNSYVDVSDRILFRAQSRWRSLRLTRLQRGFLYAAVLVSPLLSHLLLPFWLGLIALPYLVTWYVYLAYAQKDNPKRPRLLGIEWPHLPLDPVRVFQINYAFWEMIDHYLTGPPRQVAVRLYKDMLNVDYGSRNGALLDAYGSDVNRPGHVAYLSEKENRRPVMLFIYGGGWGSGDKSLYSPIARTLNARGYVVVIPNYSLWPVGTPDDMLDDIRKTVEWTFHNIRSYGGDPSNINILAHSAGAHLTVLAMLRNAMELSQACIDARVESGVPDRIDIHSEAEMVASEDILHRVHGLILMNGPYDIADHLEFETLRGVEEVSCMARLFGNNPESFAEASPTQLVALCQPYMDQGEFARHLPRNWLFLHGHRDEVVPFSSSVKLFEALDNSGIDHIVLKTYEEPDHAKLIFDLMLPGRYLPPGTPPFSVATAPPTPTTSSAMVSATADFDVELSDFFMRCRRVRRYKRWLSIVRRSLEGPHPTFREYEESLDEELRQREAAMREAAAHAAAGGVFAAEMRSREGRAMR